MIFIFDGCARCVCKYTAASPPFPVNCLHSIQLCHYSECSWDALQLILIYSITFMKAELKLSGYILLTPVFPGLLKASVPERI